MKTEIETLAHEHRDIERVLDAMVASFNRAGDEAWACKFLDSALAYLGGFERERHHRREEALFERLVTIEAPLQEVRDGLGEHRKLLADMEKDLHCSLRALRMGDRTSRTRLTEQLATYREAYRNCMAVEEGVLYPEAEAHLRPRDWQRMAFLRDVMERR